MTSEREHPVARTKRCDNLRRTSPTLQQKDMTSEREHLAQTKRCDK